MHCPDLLDEQFYFSILSLFVGICNTTDPAAQDVCAGYGYGPVHVSRVALTLFRQGMLVRRCHALEPLLARWKGCHRYMAGW